MKKKIKMTALCLLITSGAFAPMIKQPEPVQATVITPRKANTRWHYKFFPDGHLYRRLYDATHRRWLTPWQRL